MDRVSQVLDLLSREDVRHVSILHHDLREADSANARHPHQVGRQIGAHSSRPLGQRRVTAPVHDLGMRQVAEEGHGQSISLSLASPSNNTSDGTHWFGHSVISDSSFTSTPLYVMGKGGHPTPLSEPSLLSNTTYPTFPEGRRSSTTPSGSMA